jgi:hypothetical protein
MKKGDYVLVVDFWKELEKIVDLPKDTTKAVIYLEVGKPVYIETVQLVGSSGKKLEEVTKRWKLTEIGE